MSNKNSLENKRRRRKERLRKKVLSKAAEIISITTEERGKVSGLTVAKSVLWTPEE